MTLFSFPNPVNEVAARMVAAGVLVMSLFILTFDQYWVLLLLSYGFIARVLTGPNLSPLAFLVTQVLVKILPFESKPVAGPPKRFAQGMGAAMTVTATIAWASGNMTVATAIVTLIAVAATLESVFAFCIGCKLFALLMKLGVIPQSVCERCNDLSVNVVQEAHG